MDASERERLVDGRTPLELANYLDAYCGSDPKSKFHDRVHEAADVIRQLTARVSALEADAGVTDARVERLAMFIYDKESQSCRSLDAALEHRKHWRRAIPEARAMLEAALHPDTSTPRPGECPEED